jgi:hypothetical protein
LLSSLFEDFAVGARGFYEATGKGEMSEFEMVEAAELDVYPDAAAAMTEAGGGWFGRELAVKAARHALTAWAMAVNGDQTALAAMADPDRLDWLLYPESYHSWRRQWVIAPGPVLTELAITRIETDAESPQLNVKWQFRGRRRWVDAEPGVVSGAQTPGERDDELAFVGILGLTLSGSDAWPWRLGSGSHVQTLDDYLGYTFAASTETVEEYRQRTGAPAPSEGSLIPTDTYLLVADFAEHDEKFGSTATVEVSSDPGPTRDEAARLAEPAMQAECVRWRGGAVGEYRPSLSHLRVIRLLGPV